MSKKQNKREKNVLNSSSWNFFFISGPNIPVIAMLVGVLALCITGVAYMATGNKRKTLKHYSTLVQEIRN